MQELSTYSKRAFILLLLSIFLGIVKQTSWYKKRMQKYEEMSEEEKRRFGIKFLLGFTGFTCLFVGIGFFSNTLLHKLFSDGEVYFFLCVAMVLLTIVLWASFWSQESRKKRLKKQYQDLQQHTDGGRITLPLSKIQRQIHSLKVLEKISLVVTAIALFGLPIVFFVFKIDTDGRLLLLFNGVIIWALIFTVVRVPAFFSHHRLQSFVSELSYKVKCEECGTVFPLQIENMPSVEHQMWRSRFLFLHSFDVLKYSISCPTCISSTDSKVSKKNEN